MQSQWIPWDWMVHNAILDPIPHGHRQVSVTPEPQGLTKAHSSEHQNSLKTELVKEELKPLARTAAPLPRFQGHILVPCSQLWAFLTFHETLYVES